MARAGTVGRGRPFDIEASHVDEDVVGPAPVTALVRELALRKARAVAGSHMTGVVLGADTAVAVDATVLGKPVGQPPAPTQSSSTVRSAPVRTS